MASSANGKKKIAPPRRDYLSNTWSIHTSYRRVWKLKKNSGEHEEISATQLRNHLQTLLIALERPELGVLTIGPTQADELSGAEKETLERFCLKSELIHEESTTKERLAQEDFEIKTWLKPLIWTEPADPDFQETLHAFYKKIKEARERFPPYLCAWPIIGVLRDQFPDYDRKATDAAEIENAPNASHQWNGVGHRKK